MFPGAPAGALLGPGFLPLPARPRGSRRRTTARGHGRVRPCEAGPRTTGWSGRSTTRAAPTGTDRTSFGARIRTGLGPGRAGAGPGRTDRAASRTTERARPGERPAYDRGGPPPCMTCAGSARVRPRGSAPVHDPRGVRTAHDRAGFGPGTTERVGPGGRPARDGPCATRAGFGLCTKVQGSDCARPRGVRTVHHRAGLGPCTTVRGSGRVRPGRLSPGYDRTGFGPCTTARVRPVCDHEGPPPRRPCGAGPRTTVRGAGRVRPGRVSPVFDRVGPAPRTTPCGASTTYDLRDR